MSSTSCPITEGCKFGINGVGFIGSTDLAPVGYSIPGSATFTLDYNTTCALTLFNFQSNTLALKVEGDNIGIQYLKIGYPFSQKTNTLEAKGTLRIENTENVAFLYLGSTSTKSGPVKLSWSPFTETKTTSAANNLLAQTLLTALLATILLFA